VQAIRREHAAAFNRIAAEIERRVERARGELEALEHGDPAGGLSTEELQRAAAMNAFVAGEVQSLSLADLARRCRAAAGTGDRAAMFALLHHAARRQDKNLTGEVGEAVRELRTALDPDAQSKLTAARAALEEAHELKEKAYLGRRGAKDAADLYFGGGNYWGAAS
jgi:hypothetical protein